MALTRITCSHCGTGLKSPTGFAVGQVVLCPKCKKQFKVITPEDESEEFIRSVQRDLDALPTIEERDRQK